MNNIEDIKVKIAECDDEIIDILEKRLNLILDLAQYNCIKYKIQNELPVLQSEIEKLEYHNFADKLNQSEHKAEIMDVYSVIDKNSKKLTVKQLFPYNIMLIGFMGTGKTTISRYLSEALQLEEVDTDQLIVQKEGKSIADIFKEFGEDYFRKSESNTLIDLQKRSQLIVSCGGGIVLRKENVDHMKKNGRIVLLTASPETILERVKGSSERPILNDNMNIEFITELMNKRRESYKEAADIIVNTDGKDTSEIAGDIMTQLLRLKK